LSVPSIHPSIHPYICLYALDFCHTLSARHTQSQSQSQRSGLCISSIIRVQHLKLPGCCSCLGVSDDHHRHLMMMAAKKPKPQPQRCCFPHKNHTNTQGKPIIYVLQIQFSFSKNCKHTKNAGGLFIYIYIYMYMWEKGADVEVFSPNSTENCCQELQQTAPFDLLLLLFFIFIFLFIFIFCTFVNESRVKRS